jgi:G:T-mismatch repair DNA endonuclease (very short patch repair protein)
MCGRSFSTQTSLKGHRNVCPEVRALVDSTLTKEFLQEHLVNKKETANYIAKTILKDSPYNFYAGTIIGQAKKYGIKTLSMQEANHVSQERRVATNLAKYGHTNPLAYGTDSYKKRNQTVKDKYGVVNVFQLETTKEKAKKSLIERYGVERSIDLPHRVANTGQRSIPHKLTERFLEENSIAYESEVKDPSLRAFNSYLGREYTPRPDIRLKDYPVIIEVYGDTWHANPSKYKDDDLILLWTGLTPAKEIRLRDHAREEQLRAKGYFVICIWTSKGTTTHYLRDHLLPEIERCKQLLKESPESIQKTATIYL